MDFYHVPTQGKGDLFGGAQLNHVLARLEPGGVEIQSHAALRSCYRDRGQLEASSIVGGDDDRRERILPGAHSFPIECESKSDDSAYRHRVGVEREPTALLYAEVRAKVRAEVRAKI
jgi:hypothetical protein